MGRYRETVHGHTHMVAAGHGLAATQRLHAGRGRRVTVHCGGGLWTGTVDGDCE